jgi:hypothetical protein
MASMTPLDPVVSVSVDGVEFLATEAGRSGAGLAATITASNGSTLASRRVVLARPDDRSRFGEEVASASGLRAEQVERALLDLVTAVEAGLRGRTDAGDAAPRPCSQASRLVELASGELFHTRAGVPFATQEVGEHRETWPVRSKGFGDWLRERFYAETGGAPGSQAVQDALSLIGARALYEGPELPVFTRVAGNDGVVFLDLGDAGWSAVEITAGGWRVVPHPVKFRRPAAMAAMPRPEAGGTVGELRRFVNVADDGDWSLLLGWLVAALRPRGPYPLLALCGEQGSAKSTLARVCRQLVDPNFSPLRAEPGDVRDLMVAANNSWALVLDNLSYVPSKLSDALCRLSTGGGFSTRELYTNDEEVIFELQRPAILNGIGELVTRSDLLDRSVLLQLPAVPDERRRTEAEFWAEFEAARPRILGALLDAVAAGLRGEGRVRLERPPRLADFAVWVTAAEPALGLRPGQFLDAYAGNRGAAHASALEASHVGQAVLHLARLGGFRGTATALLARLEPMVGEAVRRQRSWPRSPRSLSDALRLLAPNLRAAGVRVEWDRDTGRDRGRMITVTSEAAGGAREGRGRPRPEPGPHPPAPAAGAPGTDGVALRHPVSRTGRIGRTLSR